MARRDQTQSTTRPRGRMARRERTWGLILALPWLIGFAAFYAYPIGASAYYSFTSFNIFQTPAWVGLENYAAMIADYRFWKTLYNTLYLAVFGVPLTIILALGVAVLLNAPVRGQPIYRALMYLPTIVPLVVAVYVWRWMLNPENGIVNAFLGALGLPKPLWLHDPSFTKWSILMIAFWTIGGTVVIYLAALKGVPNELYEAAMLDGAGAFRRFRHVTVPLIAPVTLFQVIVILIGYLQIFTQPYLLGREAHSNNNVALGGPNESMLTYAMYIYQNAFTYLKMGYASALAWVLFLIVLMVSLVIFRSSRKWVHYEG
ncbi:MAG: sugar ABC transporter permease [Propionicimonas sp.]